MGKRWYDPGLVQHLLHEGYDVRPGVGVVTKEEERQRHRRYTYGNESIAHYNKQIERQNSKCAICGREEIEGRHLQLDHDHKTGQLRGLLCFRCNVAIGSLGDDPVQLARAVAYLLDWRPWLRAMLETDEGAAVVMKNCRERPH